jgi:cytochrome b subunit of formate dehydrogenase
LNTGLVRRGLHVVHAASALALLATGLLLGAPDLRARLLGGYGREIAAWHDVGACAFLTAPVLALALAARPLVIDLRTRLGPPDGLTWRKVHIALTLALSTLLSGSGLVLWGGAEVPMAIYDGALGLHVAAAWALALALPLHLVAARRKLAARVREILRGGPEDALFDPECDPDE